MQPSLKSLRAVMAAGRWWKWLIVPGALVAIVGVVMSDTPPPNIPVINLAAEPLYARGARAKPTLTLDLSVEFPTVGAQYLGAAHATSDATYSTANQYIGYFDSESCYSYNDAPGIPTGAPTGAVVADYKRFDRTGNATHRTCGGTGFSGNFMNWASSSAIDILRYGLTGGDRVVDTPTLTILQRAVLQTSFWNSQNFPDKQLSPADAPGAVPSILLKTYTGVVHVANCLNRIHFGIAATGNCSSPGDNSSLGTTPATSGHGPITDYTSSLPPGFSPACAAENGTCGFSGVLQVAYGANNSWKFMSAINGTPCTNAVFGDPISGTVKACYTRADPTGWTPPSVGITTDGFFYTRVSVCASNGDGTLFDPRPDLCLRYPNGNYKPAGNLQKYSDRLRVAAFGYLNDSTGNPNERYGGVLRVPMKYVGPKSFDANFTLVSGANPNQEWDTSTGVFNANPDGNASIRSGPSNTGPYLSGVVNYLNQFGRTGAFGQYKTYDPVGELYYESIRYLQGLPITPQAVYGMTTVMQDGFPVITNWVDPHPAVTGMSDYSCVRNNIVAIGDVNTHNDKSIPGNTSRLNNENAVNIGFPSGRATNVAGNEPDFYNWTKVVGAFEAKHTEITYVDGTGVTRTVSNFNPANTARWGMENQDIGADGASYFMAGVGYWANTHDIRGSGWTSWPTTADPRRPGMRVTTYVLDVNEFGGDNDPTARHNNQFFLTAKYGGFDDVSKTGNPFLAQDLTTTNVNWQDPANPGEAQNYYLSSSAAGVLTALNNIFASIAAQANSIAGGAISTQRLTSVAGAVYQAQFDPAAWSGDLVAFGISADSSNNAVVGTVPIWKASDELAVKASSSVAPGVPGGANRNIVIGKSAATSAATATNFVWASLDSDVQAALEVPPYAPTGTPADPASTGEARLNFLRGDRANESPAGLLMRQRSTIMGDVVNSAVAFSGAPSRNISDPDYATFVTTNASRKHALFVGANDGMLHAFDSDHGTITGHSGGDELFAYIPSWMIPKLGALTSPSYVHQSYVDGSPAVAEAKVGTTWSTATWKTVLVGGTGGGGQGVFALDVSDPGNFDATKVMWEFTDHDDADMGNVIGKPQILKLRTNASNATTPDYQYFAVVASGVDNYVNDGHASSTGSPAIFLLDLSKPRGTAWSLNSNYYKISFPALTTMASGMVGFSVRAGTADAVTTLYAGDLQGNVWKLDFGQATAGKSDWNLDKLSFYKTSSSAAMPMYVALDASSNRQPITMEPTLVFGTNRSIIVSFGTGKFLEVSDNVTTGAPQQSIYALYDNNDPTADSGSGSTSAIAGRGRLLATTASGETIVTGPFTWGRALVNTPPSTDPSPVRSGWYFDLGNPGERQISDFAVVGGNVFFGSVIPSVNSCDNGSGKSYQVNLLSGDGSFGISTVGILGEPFVIQLGASTLLSSNTTGSRTETTRYQVILQGSGGLGAITPTTLTGYVGRLSWRELSNYQELRHRP
jgi:type IV pilus assembly protein PilY1